MHPSKTRVQTSGQTDRQCQIERRHSKTPAMNTLLILSVVLVCWTSRVTGQSGIICAGVQCVQDATCEGVTCKCPSYAPFGNGKFYCYQDINRLVAMEFGDPYIRTLIPSEKYKLPLPCGHLVLRGDLSSGCYVSIYANGVDLDNDIDVRKGYINGLEAIVRKGLKETRMHITDELVTTVEEVAVRNRSHAGVLQIDVEECDFKLVYRHDKAFVVADIPTGNSHFEGSMLPSKELYESIDDQAHKYNLTRMQEVLYLSIHEINSKFPECEDLRDALEECDNVADEDEATSICGQYVFTDSMSECLGQTLNAKQILQFMRTCIIEICRMRLPPCGVIQGHFGKCMHSLRGDPFKLQDCDNA